ncbi:hypothetical protein [Halobellus ruber]|uniref:Uncharacterized protein n=1 Tax=Halobellus ruber TaxID=2761102 RepID=A0A7J9SGB3_9EURY|nr:hypothetical protein [Halobellus ruber]MBB6645007.1 hypothetical protein [Halobellus ruber]
MTFGGDDRAVTVQIGAVILLGFLVISLSVYQATVVPDQNGRVEFDHSQQVQESLQDLRNGILRTASTERTSPTTVPLGTRYPTRTVAVNPPPSSGRLATEPGGNVTLVNATAIDGETADYWDGTDRVYDTQRLSYRPDYNVYQSAPRTTYADSVLYNQFGSDTGARAVTGQRLLEGNLIYVVALNGSYRQSGTQAVSVSPTPVSASDRIVAVNGDIDIEVTTELSEDEWERLLADQYESNGGQVDDDRDGVNVTDGTLTVDLVPGTYRLRMAKIGVGTDVSDTSEQYLTVVDGADSVTAGGTRRIVLEVRDSYNNPVSGVTVEAAVDGANADIVPADGTSDGRGRIVYEYSAPGSIPSPRTDSVNFSFKTPVDRSNFSGEEPESVRINVTVVSLGGGGSSDRIEYVDNSGQATDEGSGNKDESVEFTLRNTGSADVSVTDISVDSTSVASAVRVEGSPSNPAVSTNRTGEVTTDVVIGSSSEQFSSEATLSGGSDTEFVIGPFVNNGGSERQMSGEDITITLTFGDGTTQEYTITAS